MKITIDSNVLKKYDLSVEQFIILLASYYNSDYTKIQKELEQKGLAERNLFNDFPPVISDNTKNLIAKIIIESDNRIQNCPIKDFDKLASTLQSYYPKGNKAGKTYSWRGDTDTIAQKLKVLVVKYNFIFTEKEAIDAVKEYVTSFQPPYTFMHTLKNFLLYTKKENGEFEMESIFMSIIENNR